MMNRLLTRGLASIALCAVMAFPALAQEDPMKSPPGWGRDVYASYPAIRFRPEAAQGKDVGLVAVFDDRENDPASFTSKFRLWGEAGRTGYEVDYIYSPKSTVVQEVPPLALIDYYLDGAQPFPDRSVFIAMGGFAQPLAERVCEASRHLDAVIFLDFPANLNLDRAETCDAGSDMAVYIVTMGSDGRSATLEGALRDTGLYVAPLHIDADVFGAPTFSAEFQTATGASLEDFISNIIMQATTPKR